MKHAFLALFAILSAAPSFAGPQDTITAKAVLHFCPKGVMDCGGATITVRGKNYRAIGNSKSVQERLENVIGTYKFHNVTESPVFQVTGFTAVVESQGIVWGPPKGTKINVFKITGGLETLPLPKSGPPPVKNKLPGKETRPQGI